MIATQFFGKHLIYVSKGVFAERHAIVVLFEFVHDLPCLKDPVGVLKTGDWGGQEREVLLAEFNILLKAQFALLETVVEDLHRGKSSEAQDVSFKESTRRKEGEVSWRDSKTVFVVVSKESGCDKEQDEGSFNLDRLP